MNSKQWQYIESVLDDILAFPPAKRKLQLAKWFGEDAETHLIASRLVQLADLGKSCFELPSEIGGWLPLRCLGVNADSKDFLVRRSDDDDHPFGILHLGPTAFTNAASIQQFRSDLQPFDSFYDASYCRILDAGLDDSEHPYIVNDFIAGVPMLDSARDLSTRPIVSAFRSLLVAFQYAHSRNLAHGNLHTAHVLVGSDNSIRLPGFATTRILATAANGGNFILNPSFSLTDILYYSPDQLRGQPNQLSGDIYSLGVIFYQMLSGTPPYGNREESLIELAATISEKTPSKIEGLDETLNYILQKALAKTPANRYSNLTAFIKDLDDFLERRAIKATRQSGSKQSLLPALIAKVKQNWVAVSLSAAVLAISAFAVIQSTSSKLEAGEILNKTVQLVTKPDTAEKKTSNESAVQLAKNYLDGMLDESSDNPAVQRELAQSYLRLAEAELKGFGSRVIDRGLALQSSRKAYELNVLVVDRNSAKGPMTDEMALEYARSAQTFVKLLKNTKDYSEAIRVAQEWQNRFAGVSSKNIEVIRASALANTTMADLLYESGLEKQALESARLAMTQYNGIYQQDQASMQNSLDYAASARSVGTKHLALKQASEAIEAFQVSESVLRIKTDKPRPETAPLIDLAQTLIGLGEALELSKQSPKAIGTYMESRRILQRAAEKDSGNQELVFGLADNFIHTARFHASSRTPNTALEESGRAIEMLRLSLAKLDGDPAMRRLLARALTVRASALFALKRDAEAKQTREDAMAQWQHFQRSNGLGPMDREEIDTIRQMARS